MSLERLTTALAGRYRIERELGAGGMATVYLAQDLKHDRLVAIKVLKPELGAPLGSDRFLQEIRVAAKLQHPHIVGLLDSGVVPGGHTTQAVPYYVMPYIGGETLREYLARKGSLSTAETVRLTAEIANALARAHKAGIVHRDIKPDNILIAEDHAFVMDFGVAKAVSDATGRQGLTSAGMSLGTPAYMAPEQVAADPTIDHRADLYALGLVVYEMMSCSSPYAATTPQQQMAAHVTLPPTPIQQKRPDCPPALAQVIMKCLAKNPADRWQTADEIVAGLRALPATGARPGFGLAAYAAVLSVAAVLLYVVVAFGLLRRTAGDGGASGTGARSVGVMLFDNITRDTAYAYLADGLASEISTTLARVPRLEVRSPGSVRSAQRGIDPDPIEVGRRLNVSNMVEGEFQRGGDKIRIAVRLVAVPSGTQRWSDSWTRPMTDLLSVQQEIARAVATAIAGALLPQERSVLAIHPTTSAEAYDHFLRGNFLLASRTPSGALGAIAEYRSALRVDTGFAQAEARIALTYNLYSSWGWDYPGIPPDSLTALGLQAADRALTLDSSSADAWMARGGLLSDKYPKTLDGAFDAFDRATRLDPRNAEVWQQYASRLLFAGRYEESIAAYQRALTLEPRRAVTWDDLALAYELVHRDADAMAAYDSSLASNPEYYSAYASRSRMWLRRGELVRARADAEAAQRSSPPGEIQYQLGPLALVTAAEGDTAGARRMLTKVMSEMSRRPIGPLSVWLIAPGLLAAGEREQALALLEHVSPRGALLWWTMQYPELDGLRTNPRFQRVLAESKPTGAP